MTNENKKDVYEFKKQLNQDIAFFTDNYLQQFNENSIYKSNLSYLMQLIDYQLWHFNLFKPGLSLMNSFFYQLLIIIGIVTESLCVSILLDPCIETNSDPSLGNVKQDSEKIQKVLSARSFADNINMLVKLRIITEDSRKELHSIRKEIRNMVHIQNWEGRLYNSLTLDFFIEKLSRFKSLLINIKLTIQMNHSIEELQSYLNIEDSIKNKQFYGIIQSYHSDKGFGFIESQSFEKNIFFHFSKIKNYSEDISLKEGDKLSFNIKQSQKGYEAENINLE